MDFEHFRNLNGWTLDRAAEEIRKSDDPRFAGVNASVVAKHERGQRFPNPEMIERYAEITANAVTFSDWSRLRAQGGRPKRPRGRRKSAPVASTA